MMTGHEKYVRWKERHPDYTKEWNKSHRDEINAYRRRRLQENPEIRAREVGRTRKYKQKLRVAALQTIANFHGRSVECMMDMTPTFPLSDLPCRGWLEIDHLNGNGAVQRATGQPYGEKWYRIIRDGKTDLSELRILCRLHNLWNMGGFMEGPK